MEKRGWRGRWRNTAQENKRDTRVCRRRAPALRKSAPSDPLPHPKTTHTRPSGCHVAPGEGGTHRHPPALRAPLSDCDTVSVRDISTISQILVADAAGA